MDSLKDSRRKKEIRSLKRKRAKERRYIAYAMTIRMNVRYDGLGKLQKHALEYNLEEAQKKLAILQNKIDELQAANNS